MAPAKKHKKASNVIKSDTALLLIDIINRLDFPGNEEMVAAAPTLAATLKRVKKAAHKAGIITIYLNDNYNNWHANLNEILLDALEPGAPGRVLAESLAPEADDFFVLKPMHSGFYGTPLAILLNKLGVKKLILTGVAADICVLYTANDAYMRGFKLTVITDGVLANSENDTASALEKMKTLLKAKLVSADQFIKSKEK